MRLSKIWLVCLLVFAPAASSGAQTAPSSQIGQNYYDCLNGRYGCNTGALTATEQAAVAEAAHKRNYYDCLNGRYGCNTGALTTTEQPAVAEAAHKRNYYDCLNGRYGCNAGQLTSSEQATVATPKQDGSAVGVVNSFGHDASAPVSPACAENGSCYGDPNANGVPKTVHVDGYYRKDGTYVRGHYRSAPGTNPPRAHR